MTGSVKSSVRRITAGEAPNTLDQLTQQILR